MISSYFIGDLNTFRSSLKDIAIGIRKIDILPGIRHITVKSYFRKGKIVKSGIRGIKPGGKLYDSKDSFRVLKQTTKPIVKSNISKVTKPPKPFNYFSSTYNNRLSYDAKQELNNWNKFMHNFKPNKNQQQEYADTQSIVDYITKDSKKDPSSFRSITVGGKTGAMASVVKDAESKALYVHNLVANPNRFINAEEYGGSGTTMILHLINESMEHGYEGKLKLSSLPNAVRFYRKLGFTSIGNPLNYEFELLPDAARKLLDENIKLFRASSSMYIEFSNNIIAQAMDIEDIDKVVAFAIKRK